MKQLIETAGQILKGLCIGKNVSIHLFFDRRAQGGPISMKKQICTICFTISASFVWTM